MLFLKFIQCDIHNYGVIAIEKWQSILHNNFQCINRASEVEINEWINS